MISKKLDEIFEIIVVSLTILIVFNGLINIKKYYKSLD